MNNAQVIPFKKPSQPKQEAGNMYSDKFVQGYVMSSRLYRKEVWPFLSDAARNVYAELESRINGYSKESDFVSYSQLQGGELEGSRQMGRTTVADGLKELIKLGVVSIISSGKRGMKSYCLNEISIKDQFTNKTSPVTVPVQPQDQNQSDSKTTTSPATGHTIDTSLDSLEFKKTNLSVDNSKSEMFGDSVEYHCDNKNLYSLRELSKVYPVQSDLIDQIVDRCPELTNEQIMSELKNFAQWSKGRDNTTAQGWMNYWIYRIQKLSAPKAKSQKSAKAKIKGLSESQIDLFASKLTDFHDFAGKYSTPGESEKAFKARIASKLREPEYLKKWASYLADVGFVGQLEESV